MARILHTTPREKPVLTRPETEDPESEMALEAIGKRTHYVVVVVPSGAFRRMMSHSPVLTEIREKSSFAESGGGE